MQCEENSTEKYREKKDDSDEEDKEEKDKEEEDNGEEDKKEEDKKDTKSEKPLSCNLVENNPDDKQIKTLYGLHITFNLEAGSLLPLVIKLVFIFL